MSNLRMAFPINCARCNKVLNNDDGNPAHYRELIFLKVDSDPTKPIIYQTEHMGNIYLCEDCSEIVENAVRYVTNAGGRMPNDDIR